MTLGFDVTGLVVEALYLGVHYIGYYAIWRLVIHGEQSFIGAHYVRISPTGNLSTGARYMGASYIGACYIRVNVTWGYRFIGAPYTEINHTGARYFGACYIGIEVMWGLAIQGLIIPGLALSGLTLYEDQTVL